VATAAPKVAQTDTSLRVGPPGPPGGSSEASAVYDDRRARATIQTLRELFAEQGVCESHSSEEEGFYFAIESAVEVSVHYQGIEQQRASASAPPLRRNEVGLLKCCNELGQRGYGLTLFMSPRTLTLYVRYD
jgi:hypothetical protein